MAGEAIETVAAPSESDLRSQILAGIDEEPAETVEDDPAEVEPVPAAEPEVEADDDDEDDDLADDEDDADPDEDVEPESADPETRKRLDTVRRAEKRSREKLAEERAALDGERKEHAASVARVKEFEGLAKRAKYDPGSVLRALGLTEDDFGPIAQAIYAESKEGAADPKRKAAAQALLREREKEDKLTATEQKIADLEAKLEQREAAQKAQAEATQYFERINKVATAKHPLVAHMLKADPEGTGDQLVAAYGKLLKDKGTAPKPAEVVAEFDKRERTRLKKLGIDPESIAKAKPALVKGAKPAPSAPVPSGELTREQILASLTD